MAAPYETTINLYLQLRKSAQTSYGPIFAARAADVIWPNSVILERNDGSGTGGFRVEGTPLPGMTRPLAEVAVKTFLKKQGFDIVLYPALNLAVNDDYTFPANDPPQWVTNAFSWGSYQTKPFYTSAWTSLKAITLDRVSKALPIPGPLLNTIARLIGCGFIVYPSNTSAPWVMTREHQEIWNAIVAESKHAVGNYNQANLSHIAANGDLLARNAEFWEKMERITVAVATGGLSEAKRKIDETRAALRQFKQAKTAALAYADRPTTNAAEAAKIRATISQQEADIRAKVGALALVVPGLKEELSTEGLGAIQWAAVIAASAVIAKALAVITACATAIYLLNALGILDLLGALRDTAQAGRKYLGPAFGALVLVGGWFAYTKLKKKRASA